VITITAYTEPVPAPAVSETPPVHESEDNEEHSDFEEILASLLRNDENTEQSDIHLSDSSGLGTEIDALAGENLKAGVPHDLFDDAQEIGIIRKKDLSKQEFPQKKPSEKQQDIFFGVEQLFSSLEQQIRSEIQDDSESEITGVKLKNLSPESDQLPDFSSVAELAETDFAQEAYASLKTAEDTLSAQTENKKERTFAKGENAGELNVKNRHDEAPVQIRKEDIPGRLDEMRSRSRRDRIAIEIRDLRTGTANVNNMETRSFSAVETSVGRASGEVPLREITLELHLPDQNAGSVGQSSSQTTWEVKASNALENMLARELHQNFNGDIVRHASMALRDGGEGTIRIALKPESLGNVKIRLEMTENRITGHIVVESEEALNAFRKEITSLEQAFRDSGFTNADLNLSMTWDGQGAQGQEEDTFTPRMIASRYDNSYEYDALPMVDVFFGQKSGSINMLA